MLVDHTFHARHATIANLKCVLVEDLVVLMISFKVFLNETYKSFTNVCFHMATVWGVKAYIFSLACSFWLWCSDVL